MSSSDKLAFSRCSSLASVVIQSSRTLLWGCSACCYRLENTIAMDVYSKAGANISGDLKNASKSTPYGTMVGEVISFNTYL